ncbi:MAG: hypothetical protein VKK42_08975 [Lyngbya sp.]|nr:hypothetical protein [Lyngbya sp.]
MIGLTQLARRFQRRLLDFDKYEDYLIVSFIAFIPIPFSMIIGIWNPIEYIDNQKNIQHTAYSEASNFLGLLLILPLSLFILRLTSLFFFGTTNNKKNYKVLLLSMFHEQAHDEISKNLKSTALDPSIPLIVLFFNIVHHFLDTRKILSQYFLFFTNSSFKYPERIYWANISLVNLVDGEKQINVCTNLFFTIAAYTPQFITIFIGFTGFVLLLKYNFFYLSLIYQRSKAKKDAIYYIVLDFDDSSKCFGQKRIFWIFNIQLIILTIAGVFLCFSRYEVIPPTHFIDFCITTKNFTREFFIFCNLKINILQPEFGQYAIVFVWLITCFIIIILPSSVKFLPCFSREIISKGYSIGDYLKEYIPPHHKFDFENTDYNKIKKLVQSFQCNSFWPAGDGIVVVFLMFVFFVGFNILFPIKFTINLSDFNEIIDSIFNLLILFLLALFFAIIFFEVYNLILGRLDGIKGTKNSGGNTYVDNTFENNPNSNFNIVEHNYGQVGVTINQLPDSSNQNQGELKELLKQLNEAIRSDEKLSEKDKVKAFKQVEELAKAGQNPKDEEKKGIADTALTMLTGIVAGLPSIAASAKAVQELVPLISKIFGL